MKLSPVQVTPQLEAYLQELIDPHDPVLQRLEAEIETGSVPGIGPLVGSLLALMLRMNRCADVLELGTALGYSSIWLGRGCSGRVVTLERDPAMAATARANLKAAGLADRVSVVEEDALDFLAREGDPFDAVFNDLLTSFPDAATAEHCVRLSKARLRPRGLLLADNALRRGEVVRPHGRAALNVDRYNRLLAADPDLEAVVVPMRDGVSIARLRA
ncbi:MAG: O-methyltransferase [Candidatus Dormibacteraeota bacterium]|nr:O-methyltransferase [Candidatus Dormibacteraeota bacterium]